MSTHCLSLEAFVQQVLSCKQPVVLEQVLAQLDRATGSGSQHVQAVEYLVVADDQAQPIGCIPLVKLLTTHRLSPSGLTVVKPLLESIDCLPSDTSLEDFWQKLRVPVETTAAHWGVTDVLSGEFLGLVNVAKILPALAQWVPHSKAIPEPTAALQMQVEQLTLESRFKTELLAEIGHDLKNPVTAILGLFNVFQQGNAEHFTERQTRYLQLIDDKNQQLLSLVQKVLFFSQLQSQQMTLQPEIVDVAPLCRQAIASMIESSEVEIAPAHVRLYVDKRVPDLVADRNGIEQLLSHLLKQGLALSRSPVELQVTFWGGWVGFTLSAAATQLSQSPARMSRETKRSLQSA